MQFNDEDQTPPTRAPKVIPWPIKLAMKCGIKSEQTATIVVLVISGILLIATFVMYKQLFFPAKSVVGIEDLTPEMRLQLESTGIDINKLGNERR